MLQKTLHIIRLIFLYASILFLATVDLIWFLFKNMPLGLIFVVFLGLILSIYLRAFAKKKILLLIILSDIILIASSHWTFTHRALSWIIEHIFMEPTFPITVIAILIIIGDWVIRIRRNSIRNTDAK